MIEPPNEPFFDDSEDFDEMDDERMFQMDFMRGVEAFLFVASQLKMDPTPPGEVFSNMIKEIIGNRKNTTIKFDDIFERIYERTIEYCKDSIDIATIMEDASREHLYQEYKKSLKKIRRKKINKKKSPTKKKITKKGKK
jgi:hypothetical protein